MSQIKRWALMSNVVLALVLLACTDAAGPGPDPTPYPAVASVTISPVPQTLQVGAFVDLVATPRDAQNNELLGLTTVWSSTSPDVATVGSNGRLVAMAEGVTTITATIDGKSGSVTVNVTPLPGDITIIVIDPAATNLQEGTTQVFTATAYDVDGRVVPVTQFTWEVNDATIGTVTQDGIVTVLRPGTLGVKARFGGRSAIAIVEVFAAWPFDLVYDAVTSTGPGLFALDIRLPDGFGAPQAILPAGAFGSDPTPSPNGSKIAYVANEATRTVIYIANRDGSNPVRLTQETGFADQPAWSPDGLQLAYRYRAVAGGATDIWTVDATGANAVNRTSDMGDLSFESDPAWGPRIAFVRMLQGTFQIWKMRPDGVGKIRVTTTLTDFDTSPSWSPDGLQIAFLRNSKLWVVSEGGTDPHELIALGGSQWSPAWSPDGRIIAFLSTTYETPGVLLYTVWADGTRLARRTGAEDYLGNVAWRMR